MSRRSPNITAHSRDRRAIPPSGAGGLGISKYYAPSLRSNRVRATRTTMPFSLLALVPGTRIGVYDITTQIGACGMGEAVELTSGGL